MEQAIKILLPVVTFGLMVLVGLDLTPQGLREALSRRRALIAGLFAPWLLVPPIILVTLRLWAPAPEVETALLLMSACPVGGMANFHTFLARGNTALSVTLTSASGLAAAATLPGFLWIYSRFSPGVASFALPPAVLATHVVGLLIAPSLIGLAIRRRWPDAVVRAEKQIRAIGLSGLLLLLILATWNKPAAFVAGLGASGPLVVFTLACLGAGYGLQRLLGLARGDAFAVVMQLPVRNLAIASVIALNLLEKAEYAALATAFYVVQTLLLLGVVLAYRRGNGSLASTGGERDTG